MKSILIVDDDKTNLISAKNALNDLYKIIAVTSGAQALKYLEKNLCDMILLDINMPEMDGFEVLAKIRENESLSQIPIIFLTADDDSETENKCLEVGAVDYIAKPFVLKVLRSRVGRTLELKEFQENLEQLVEEKTERITYIQNMTVLGMATMVESRDNSTGGHIRRTGDVVKVIQDISLGDRDIFLLWHVRWRKTGHLQKRFLTDCPRQNRRYPPLLSWIV